MCWVPLVVWIPLPIIFVVSAVFGVAAIARQGQIGVIIGVILISAARLKVFNMPVAILNLMFTIAAKTLLFLAKNSIQSAMALTADKFIPELVFRLLFKASRGCIALNCPHR